MYAESDWERRKAISNDEPYRSSVRRDSARVIHCAAFRRLQGKTQLFPGVESDFFRNRLTHSLEVGQIAKSIAYRLNGTVAFLAEPGFQIDPDLAELAGWCHDLGHPPFGHNGETALDELLRESAGGFEGNAQTLRILGTLEKRDTLGGHSSGISDSGRDERLGLNLCARTLAAILKYDLEIPSRNDDRGAGKGSVVKGYYHEERSLVAWIKEKVLSGRRYTGDFKTVECQIMDLADDIAYSTYDLEDAFHAGFMTPLDILAVPADVIDAVAARVQRAIGESFEASDVTDMLRLVFRSLGATTDATEDNSLSHAVAVQTASRNLSVDGYLRAQFTSSLITKYINAVEFLPNNEVPALSRVCLRPEVRAEVEVLKNVSFVGLILRPRLKLAEYRGKQIIKEMFETLRGADGGLMPDDFRSVHARLNQPSARDRIISDFIAGMTDRYASEFHGRLRSESPQSIFKPI